MSIPRSFLAFALGVLVTAAVLSPARAPLPASDGPAVERPVAETAADAPGLHPSVLAGSERAVDRIYLLEHRMLALRLEVDQLRERLDDDASPAPTVSPAFLPSVRVPFGNG